MSDQQEHSSEQAAAEAGYGPPIDLAAAEQAGTWPYDHGAPMSPEQQRDFYMPQVGEPVDPADETAGRRVPDPTGQGTDAILVSAVDLANAAVAAERARIRRALRSQMDDAVTSYRNPGDGARQRAYALGVITAVHIASGDLGDGLAPLTPGFDAQAACDRLGV